jgi:hypothetical protein
LAILIDCADEEQGVEWWVIAVILNEGAKINASCVGCGNSVRGKIQAHRLPVVC